MKLYVGITDRNWYHRLSDQRPDEVNFWNPGGKAPCALEENDLFLFKLPFPENAVAGGGFFVRFVTLPLFLAWDAFGEKNGTATEEDLRASIRRYRSSKGGGQGEAPIGCTILTEPFWFEEADWIFMSDWPKNIVRGKSFSPQEPAGRRLLEQVQERIPRARSSQPEEVRSEDRYTQVSTRHRLGQGAFRALVTDAYGGSCAITGEKTLPVLQAAHIVPYAQEGPHLVTNGLLLKSDFHTLFDDGYLTVTPDYHVEVSHRLREDFHNGKEYYRYQGSPMYLPREGQQRPDPRFLEWHNEHVYKG